jgi:hypothetical protein
MEVESIGCTKLRGCPCFLDGNKLYFIAELKDKDGNLSQTKCCMDCSISRKKWDLVKDNQWPIEPQPWEGTLSWEVYAHSLWTEHMYRLEVISGRNFEFRIDDGNFKYRMVPWRDCTVSDFLKIYENKWIPQNAGQIVQEGDATQAFANLRKVVRQEAEQRAANETQMVRQLKNVNFKPMREIGEGDTAFLLGLFNFDGDKKALCTALKSSWNADLSDKDVKVDSLITKRFTLPKPLEEYIP